MAAGQNLIPHSDSRKGFSTHNSVGTNNLANPLLPEVTAVDGTVGRFQPGMIELKEADGSPHYLWVDSTGDLRILAGATPTDPENDGTVIGGQS
jgi:hypothetical protein